MPKKVVGKVRGRVWILIAIGVALLLTMSFFQEPIQIWRSQSRFERQTDESKLLGKTRDEVLLVLGQPYDEPVYADGSRDMIYDGPYGTVCRIEIREGMTKRVVHWIK